MAEENATLLVLVVVAVVAVIGLGLSFASFVTDQSYGRMMGGGGMMGGTGGTTTSTAGPGALEWTILILSAAFFALALVLLLRGRKAPTSSPESASSGPSAPAFPPVAPPARPAAASPPAATEVFASAEAAVAEPTLVKLLSEDERRMYLELRGHGGEMFQRDLVALGIFSKAKVTRVLDKLEAKGLVVREAHGMTNRVRLVTRPSR